MSFIYFFLNLYLLNSVYLKNLSKQDYLIVHCIAFWRRPLFFQLFWISLVSRKKGVKLCIFSYLGVFYFKFDANLFKETSKWCYFKNYIWVYFSLEMLVSLSIIIILSKTSFLYSTFATSGKTALYLITVSSWVCLCKEFKVLIF